MLVLRFRCPECGFGNHEVGHLTAEDEIYCLVCLEEEDRLIRLNRWQGEVEIAHARIRLADAA